ncbi:hypothetical protein JCM6882_002231 [Rhodosporidiobolus microsporus]
MIRSIRPYGEPVQQRGTGRSAECRRQEVQRERETEETVETQSDSLAIQSTELDPPQSTPSPFDPSSPHFVDSFPLPSTSSASFAPRRPFSSARRYRPFPLDSTAGEDSSTPPSDPPEAETLLQLLEEALEESDAFRAQLADIEPQQRVAEMLAARELKEARAEAAAAREEAKAVKQERDDLRVEADKVAPLQGEVRHLVTSRDKARQERDLARAQLAVCRGQLSAAAAVARARGGTTNSTRTPSSSSPSGDVGNSSAPAVALSATVDEIRKLTLERDSLRAELSAKETEVEAFKLEQTRVAIVLQDEREKWEKERRASSGGRRGSSSSGIVDGGWEGGGGLSEGADAEADAQAQLDECLLILDDLMRENEAVRRRHEELEERIGELEALVRDRGE